MKITKRKEGEWVVDFTENRRRIRRKIMGTKKMAEQAARLERERILRDRYGIPYPKKKIKFEDYMKFYRENYTVEKRSAKNEIYSLRRLNSYFKGKFMDEITPGLVDKYKQKRKKDGLRNSTINGELSLLRTMFNKLINSEDYGIHRNPVSKAGLLKANSFRERYMTRDEIQRLMEAAEANPWTGHLPLFLTIALNTGMRKMEILSLHWSDVDFEKGIITVTRKRSKSEKTRHVPMNDIVYDAFQRVERQSEFIFYNPDTKTHIKNIKTTFWRACKKAKIEDLTVHDLRHTAASFLVNECGVSIAVAMKILGHSSVEMTMRYVHTRPEDEQLGIDRLGEIFRKTRQKVDKVSSVVQIEKPHSPHINVH